MLKALRKLRKFSAFAADWKHGFGADEAIKLRTRLKSFSGEMLCTFSMSWNL